MRTRILWAILLVLGAIAVWYALPSADDTLSSTDIPKHPDFNFDVRPILSNQCFLCHGPDSSSRKAGLRLDTYEDITALLESGNRAVVPGSPKKSALIQRITATEEGMVMPPPETKKTLTDREIQILKNWIKDGAKWDRYWAFIPPKKTSVPEGQSPIDYFIEEKLAQKGLPKGDPADRAQLARRLSFGLLGLPPNPEMVQTFVADDQPDAYQRLVDTLLASPHFGERWARHWMDLVRYADTKGHEFDYPIDGAWRYRDYLIRAFNADVPYDQFVQEHLAGDLLAKPRLHPQDGYNESVMATAFYCLSEGKHSPVDIKEEEVDRIDNMIDVTTKTFMALTVGCAKCHDHKFDPITATDYYALYGMLESSRFTNYPAQQQVATFDKIPSIDEQLAQIKSYLKEIIEPEVEQTARAINTNYAASTNKKERTIIGDFRDGGFSGWYNDGNLFVNTLGMPIREQSHWQVATGKVASHFYRKGLPGALRSPNFIIEKDSLVVRARGQHTMIRVVIDNFQLIQFPIYGGLSHKLASEQFQHYRVDLSMWKGHKAYVELLNGEYDRFRRHAFYQDAEAWLEAEFAFAYDQWSDIQQLVESKPPNPVLSAQGLQAWLAGNGTAENISGINQVLRKQKRTPAKLQEAWTAFEMDKEAVGNALFDTTFLVGVTDGDPVESHVFLRGNHLELSTESVPHRYFSALTDDPLVFQQSNSGRLDLAEALTQPDHPLTARVMVNRVWHHLFGRGLVETVDNFGLQGKIPTHPKLLDHLAIYFVEQDWSIKQLIRYILLSETFQRSTAIVEGQEEKDPQNLLLAHYPVRRMEAEAIRDAILACSGKLDTTLFGPSIPIYLTAFLKGRGRPPASGPLDGYGRRSVYQQINRNFLPPNMLAFDMPTPFTTFGKRNVSNVPAQSLTLMNDPFVKEMATHWANELLKREQSFEDRLQEVYWRAFSREPTPDELETAKSFFEGHEQSAAQWADYCHVVFNMKAFIYLI